ncbi:hypothetical protein C1I99_29495 [Micromonospora deserti]|uniref:Insertion element IS402-like domain-containing protein n=1 Tax=Micromonospora deserti TaxID=2070366 RepID=A0A2W2CJM0_9ACTN|nr:hypothetical protein C1I99_29495 [Micromonospora deserti]
MINRILYRLRTGIPWRDLPTQYGPWKNGADAGQQTAPGTRSSAPFWPMPTPKAASTGAWSASTPLPSTPSISSYQTPRSPAGPSVSSAARCVPPSPDPPPRSPLVLGGTAAGRPKGTCRDHP